jgi:hypothetical protein
VRGNEVKESDMGRRGVEVGWNGEVGSGVEVGSSGENC